jgi:hypothetical protein
MKHYNNMYEVLPLEIIQMIVLMACKMYTCGGILRSVHTTWRDIIDQQHIPKTTTISHWAVSLSTAEWAYKEGCRSLYIYMNAVKIGQLEIIKWGWTKGCKNNRRDCEIAAMGGHIETVKLFIDNGAKWDAWICNYAALGGHLKFIQWALSEGCTCTHVVCTYAAKGGYLKLLKWLINEGHTCYKLSCQIYANAQNHHHIMEYLHSLPSYTNNIM